MMRMAGIGAMLFAFLLLGTGFGAAEETSGPEIPPDRVLAKVGDETITQAYFDMVFGQIPPQAKAQWDNPNAKRTLLREIIEARLMAKEARRLNLDKDPVVSSMIQSTVERVLATKYQEHLLEQTQVTDEEAKAYWEQNKDRFNQPEQIQVRHIVVRTEKDMENVQAELGAGKDFAEVAKENSIGPARQSGGDLGWITRGYILPPLEEAVFGLKIGETSAPVQTQFGYHLLKLYDRKPVVEKTYEEVKEQVRQTVRRERATREIEEAKLRLGTEYGVEVINDPATYLPPKAALRPKADSQEEPKD